MARAAVAQRHLVDTGSFDLIGLPCLSEKAHEVYKEILPHRLEQFPQPSKHQDMFSCLHPRMYDYDKQQSEWCHELRHDAESAFWLLVWWAVHIEPKPKDRTKQPKDHKRSTIPQSVWDQLTEVDVDTRVDKRDLFLLALLKGHPWLDPAYAGMNDLFQKMVDQIHGDLYWVNKGAARDGVKFPVEMEKPDFLHEALQRLIFNFLIEHEHDAFMKLETDTTHRKTSPGAFRVTDTPVSKISLGPLPDKKCSRNKME